MHRLLKRQLKKVGLTSNDLDNAKIKQLVSAVSRAYNDNDTHRNLILNTLTISSKEMSELHKNLRYASQHDELTGLPNRSHLEEDLVVKIINQTIKSKEYFALCFIDLDHFKKINDTLSHSIGDKLLQQFATKVSSQLDDDDVFSRIGGDEFIIILNNIKHKSEIKIKIDRILTMIRKTWMIGRHELVITASVGVSIFPDDGKDISNLMMKSDLAMYQAKSLGRNNCYFYESKLEEKVSIDMALMQRMPKALDQGEFELHYQPSMHVKSGNIIGAEALVRWNHPTRGLIYPDSFISVAEDTGFILKFGTWIINECCLAIARINRSRPNDPLCISVNISIRQFQQGDVYNDIKKAIKHSEIDPSHLAIEITESILSDNTDDIVTQLNMIKTLGIKVYLDDFGTGYSSLAYIKKLPIDVIKIDKLFVDEIHKKGSSKILLNTIVEMGKVLNKTVIAEGVEEEYQREYLASQHCDVYQGYLSSKAIPENELLNFITQH